MGIQVEDVPRDVLWSRRIFRRTMQRVRAGWRSETLPAPDLSLDEGWSIPKVLSLALFIQREEAANDIPWTVGAAAAAIPLLAIKGI